MYPLGTLKVAWVDKNSEYLSSDMFKPNELNKAVAYGNRKGNHLIMQLVQQEKDKYHWKVLSYGNYKEYLAGVRFNNIVESDFASFTNEEDTQLIRLADVFFIGPVLIFASTFKTLPAYLRVLLLFIGIATIIYNGKNYLKNK